MKNHFNILTFFQRKNHFNEINPHKFAHVIFFSYLCSGFRMQITHGFLRGVMAKLSNERFVQNAKPEIVALEQKKKADAESRIASLEEAIKALKK